jgi:hypothetical protein
MCVRIGLHDTTIHRSSHVDGVQVQLKLQYTATTIVAPLAGAVYDFSMSPVRDLSVILISNTTTPTEL